MTQQTTEIAVSAEGAGRDTGPAQQEPFMEEPISSGGELPKNLEEIVERAIEIRRENRDLKSRMDGNTAELAQLDPIIAEQFAKRQIQSQKRTTGETIYIEKSTYASLVRDEDGEHGGAHRAMREHGLEWLVRDKVESNSLSAWVREQQRQESEIPEGLLPFLKISEVYRVKVRL